MSVVEAVEALPKSDGIGAARMRSRGTAASAARRRLAKAVDDVLEISVGGSFSRIGYVVRRRLEGWADPGRLEGKTMIVTGASSGIGRAAAIQLAGLGAEVWLVGRNAERLRAASRGRRERRRKRSGPYGGG